MGNKSSTSQAKKDHNRFNKDMETVALLVQEGKEAEELQEYKVSHIKYKEACQVLYYLLEQTNLPNTIQEETKELVWDLVQQSKRQLVYQKLLDIANQPRLDAYDNAINNNQDVEINSDEDNVEENFQQLKRDVDSIPPSALENDSAMFQMQIAMAKKEMESSDEEEEEEEEQIPSRKFSHLQETIKDNIKSALEDQELTCNSQEEIQNIQKVMEDIEKKFNLHSEQGVLQDLMRRTLWERDTEKRLLEWERQNMEQLVRQEFLKEGRESSKINQGGSACKVKNGENEEDKDEQQLTKRIERLVKKPSAERDSKPKLHDVIGLKAVKKVLKVGVQDPIDRPSMVARGVFTPLSGLLLYGPPGTGKSMLAEALANEANNCSFMQISKSDITSKWLGESEKLVSTVFKVAKENAPCIIFIDEVEGIFKDRNDKNGGGASLVQDILTNMQNLGEKSVFVLAATNNPWDIDAAFLRRFENAFYVPLPTLQDRITIFKNLLTPKTNEVEPPMLSEYDFEKLGLLTPNYSGGHIKNIVKCATMSMLLRTKEATHFRRSTFKGRMQPCGPSERGAKKMRYEDVKEVHYPPVTMEDMEKAMFLVKAQIDVEHLRKLKEWGRKNSAMVTDL